MRFTCWNFSSILCLLFVLIQTFNSTGQITYLNFSGLTNTTNLVNQPIGTTGFTFSAHITNSVSGIYNPSANTNGRITLRMNSNTSVQCLNLNFPSGAEVYITDHPTSSSSNVFNNSDSVILSTSSFILTDPLLKFNIYPNSFSPNSSVSTYSNWSAILYGNSNYSVCAMRAPSSGSGNTKIPLKIGVVTATLPVEFENLEISCNQDSTVIQWNTLTERSNDYFLIEVSTDGINWLETDTLKGAGSSFEEIKYYCTLSTFKNAVKYLRLSQVDFDGNTTVLAEKSIMCAVQNVLPYPNPTKDIVKFKLKPNSIYSLQVVNCLGQELPKDEWEMNTTFSQIEVNLGKLQPGIYFVRINNKTHRVLKY